MRYIFIPSKGRAQTITSHKHLPCIIVVEPHEEVEYKYLVSPQIKLMPLNKSHQGISYVRNQILEFAREYNIKEYWMLDDDIKKFTFKGKDCSAEFAFEEAERHLSQVPGLGQGAMEYGQFSWGQKKPLTLNGYCDVAVWMKTQNLDNLNYRSYFNLKEDRDFTLQVLASGKRTARASQVGFVAPKNGSNKGGLQDEYRSGRESEASLRMVIEWGSNICAPNIKPDGRPDVKIQWKNAFRLRAK